MFDDIPEGPIQPSLSPGDGPDATMEVPPLEIVVAMTREGVIGRGNDLPWKLRDDLRRFRQLTTGHVLLTGRRTQESIGRPLPKRHTLVLSRREPSVEEQQPGLTWIRTFAEAGPAARAAAHRTPELQSAPIYCIGGAEIYRMALPFARALHVTWVEGEVQGDVFFPAVNWDEWLVDPETVEEWTADERNEFATRFEVCRRRTAGT